jgi:hypothetical protein
VHHASKVQLIKTGKRASSHLFLSFSSAPKKIVELKTSLALVVDPGRSSLYFFAHIARDMSAQGCQVQEYKHEVQN